MLGLHQVEDLHTFLQFLQVESGLLNRQMWEPGEELIADRGFTREDYLSPLEVKLVIPSFLKGWEQFTEEEVKKVSK